MFRLARRIVGNEAVAEEILQESYMSLWSRQGRTYPSNPEAWLMKTSVNRSIDYLRRRNVRKETDFNEDRTDGNEAPAYCGPARWELEALLDSALQRLAPRERAAFVLKRLEGYSYEEISVITGVALSTVRNQVMNAGRKVEDVFREAGVEP